MSDPSELVVLTKLTDFFDSLEIDYAIGGSMASSIYGTVRFTQDADITISVSEVLADRLYEGLKADFYISKKAMHHALTSCGCFNIVHFRTAFKIDMFIQGKDEFDKQLLLRARKIKISDSIDKEFVFISPEDIILLKLKWYRESERVSERQWSDVLGILAVQEGKLDIDYLKNWSEKLDLAELFNRSVSESKK